MARQKHSRMQIKKKKKNVRHSTTSVQLLRALLECVVFRVALVREHDRVDVELVRGPCDVSEPLPQLRAPLCLRALRLADGAAVCVALEMPCTQAARGLGDPPVEDRIGRPRRGPVVLCRLLSRPSRRRSRRAGRLRHDGLCVCVCGLLTVWGKKKTGALYFPQTRGGCLKAARAVPTR